MHCPGRIGAVILALLPGRLQAFVRRLMGQKIDRSARIGFGTLIFSRDVQLGPNAKVGPFSFVNTRSLAMDKGAKIQPLAILQCGGVHLKENSHLAFFAIVYSEVLDGADFVLGVESRISPFCWIEPGEGIVLGDQVGVGNYSMIYTHGAWPNYLKGGPVKYGPVKIGDNTWLPARVFVMPGVTIGSNVIVQGGSVVTKDLESDCIYAGFPLVRIRKGLVKELDDHKLSLRIQKLKDEFSLYQKRRHRVDGLSVGLAPTAKPMDVVFHRELPASWQGQLDICLADESFIIAEPRQELLDFVAFLRRFGVRLKERRVRRSEPSSI